MKAKASRTGTATRCWRPGDCADKILRRTAHHRTAEDSDPEPALDESNDLGATSDDLEALADIS
jgi:hypothetical protein